MNKIMRFRDPEMRGRLFGNQIRDCYLSQKAVFFLVNLCVCLKLSQTYRFASAFRDLAARVKFLSFLSTIHQCSISRCTELIEQMNWKYCSRQYLRYMLHYISTVYLEERRKTTKKIWSG